MIVDEVKPLVVAAIDSEADSLHALSQKIWKHPELNFDEKNAHAALTDYLEAKGFSVQRGYHLPTAFRAEFVAPGGADGITVCVMCEYDALPQIGHACGHNLIAEAGVGAGLGIKAAMEANKKITGKLVVMGTPAEEGGGGKLLLMKAGALKDVDFAMMAHPTLGDVLYSSTLAIQEVEVQFFGREAHAAGAPWEGINALDAAVSCYTNIGLCRQQMKPTWRVHGIITNGGVKPNIIPGETAMNFYIRAPTWPEVEALKKMVVGCFEAAAKSSGCRMEYKFNENNKYDSLLLNGPMLEAYRKYGVEVGINFIDQRSGGSTDMGNVSQVIPSIHPMFGIPTTAVNHTKEFTAASGSPEAQVPTLKTARCLALTALQLFTDSQLRQQSRKAFEEGRKNVIDPLLDNLVAKAYADAKGHK